MALTRSLDVLGHTLAGPPVSPYVHVPRPLLPAVVVEAPSTPSEHEHKYLLDGEAAGAVWAAAAAHLTLQLRDPTRPINFARTTYFDTRDLSYYRSDRGPVARRLRVREYATATTLADQPHLAGPCFLELKQSAGGLRSKDRLELDAEKVVGHLARHADAPLTPVLTTWYQRQSLVDQTGLLRVTLDHGVTFCAPISVGSPCAGPPPTVLARGPAFVLEIKRTGDAPAWLDRALAGLEEAVGFSKFCTGMLAVATWR